MQLFRQQAIDHQHRLYGEVLLVQPLRWRTIGFLLAVLAAAVFLFLILGSYGRTVAVTGSSLSDGQIELAVPSSALPDVAPGKEVRVTITASPDHSQSILHGIIEQAGATSKPDDRTHVPVVARLSNAIALQPGLALDVRIVTTRRSFFEWLSQPNAAIARR